MSWILDGISVAVIIFAIIGKTGVAKAGIKPILLGILYGAVIMLIVANLFWVVVKANGNRGRFFNYENVDNSYVFHVFVIPGKPDGGIEDAIIDKNKEINSSLNEVERNAEAERN
jgi:hypothetical protein